MSTKKFANENKFIGRVLKRVRNANNMTLKEFSQVIDMSPGYLSEVERGLKLPGSELFISLKRKFNVDLNIFFQFESEGQVSEDEIPYVYRDRLKNMRARIKKVKDPKERFEMIEMLLDIYEEKSE